MSFLLSCLLLNSHFSPLDFCSHFSNLELSHSSVINHLLFLPNSNLAKQTLVFPSQFQNLKLSPNHFSLLSLSHIIFLPNPNPTEQLVVFSSQSQIFRLPPTIFLFSFALSHIIFFPYPNPSEQIVIFPSQILNLRLPPNLPLFKNTSPHSHSHSQDLSLILNLALSQGKTFLSSSHEIANT